MYSYDRRQATIGTTPPTVYYKDGRKEPLDSNLWGEIVRTFQAVTEFRNPPWLDAKLKSRMSRMGLWHDFYRYDIDEKDSKILWNFLDWVQTGATRGMPESWLPLLQPSVVNTIKLLQKVEPEAIANYRVFKEQLAKFAKSHEGALTPRGIFGVGMTTHQINDTLRHMFYDGLLDWDKTRKVFTLKNP